MQGPAEGSKPSKRVAAVSASAAIVAIAAGAVAGAVAGTGTGANANKIGMSAATDKSFIKSAGYTCAAVITFCI